MSVEPERADIVTALVGRAPELERLHGFLDAAATDGAALLVSGEPGVGKTALLQAAAEAAAARGALVLPAGGVEFEADVAFSTLNQLLLPLYDGSSGLTAERRDALAAALGLVDGPAPDRATVSRAALDLLRRTTVTRPVVLLVDDLHWVDRASAAVLGLVARNVSGSAIGFLAAYRSGAESFFDATLLTVCELSPLDDAAAASLVRRRFPMLAPRVLHRVLAEAGGYPLALVELPSALTGPQRSARQRLPSLLPLSGRLQELFGARVRDLPEPTRGLLLVAALEGSGNLDLLHPAGTGGVADGLMAPAVKARLVTVDRAAHRLTFRHPLVRSTVVAVSNLKDRRQAHEALAQVLVDEPDRRAWHLSEATVGPDEQVAGLMEETAYRILRRGDAVGAVNALLRSADLSPHPSDRSRRLAEAAYVGADVAGELRSATRLLLDARRTDPHAGGSLRAAIAASYVLLNGEGDTTAAHRLLVGALATASVGGPPDGDGPPRGALLEALHTLLFVCLWGERPEHWESFRTARALLGEEEEPLLDLQAQLLGDPARAGRSALERLDAAISGLGGEADPSTIERVAQAGTFVDRVPACREALWRVVRNGRDGGAVTVGLNALVQLCVDALLTGRWDESLALADEGLRVCTAHGYGLVEWPFRHAQALVAAGRGQYEAALTVADEMTHWATPRGVSAVEVMAHHIRTVAALGQGRFEDAFHHAAAVSPAGALAPNVAQALWLVTDLVEAAVHSGRRVEAAAHVQALQRAGIAELSPRLALVVAGATAMTAPDDRFVELFETALAADDVGHWPFDVARVRLSYGERLRRARRTSSSRVQLAAALVIFQRVGALPWIARADNELRATGLPRPRAGESAPSGLTPQEHQVAMLASSGLTNRQIAARLSISPRTVAAHLRQVFPKLDVTSRSALRAALGRPAGNGARPVAAPSGPS